jgi:hypothetical protein
MSLSRPQSDAVVEFYGQACVVEEKVFGGEKQKAEPYVPSGMLCVSWPHVIPLLPA